MSRRGERKVFDIPWLREGVEVKVPVKMVTKKNYDSGKDEMTFRAVYEKAGVKVEGNDINKVREEVLEKLNEWYTIDWDLYFLIEVYGNPRGQQHNGLEVVYEFEFYAIGEDVRGNTRHMRVPRPEKIGNFKKEKMVRYAGENPREGLPATGGKMKGDWSYRPDRTCSLVRATPENVAAADKFLKAMKSLVERMHEHFAPENVEKFLARAANLLPAPKGEEK